MYCISGVLFWLLSRKRFFDLSLWFPSLSCLLLTTCFDHGCTCTLKPSKRRSTKVDPLKPTRQFKANLVPFTLKNPFCSGVVDGKDKGLGKVHFWPVLGLAVFTSFRFCMARRRAGSLFRLEDDLEVEPILFSLEGALKRSAERSKDDDIIHRHDVPVTPTREEEKTTGRGEQKKKKRKAHLPIDANPSSSRQYGSVILFDSSPSGTPPHASQTTKEQETTLTELQKKIEKARTEIQKLNTEESRIREQVQQLELREQSLLKSCEKLQEMSLTTSTPVPDKKSRGRKLTTTQPIPTVASEHTMEVDLRDVQVCELLGTGASGATVYLVNVGGWCCAMKELPRNISNEMNSEFFEKEMALLYQMPNHPNIARYLFHRKLRGRYCLFMSRYSGTLRDIIKQRLVTQDFLAPRYLVKIVHDIADGLAFLHSLNIIHRDLKASHVTLFGIFLRS